MTSYKRLLPDVISLRGGGHKPPSGDVPYDMCVMEAVAWVAGEPWSDSPTCASPVLAAFLRSWNDSLPNDAERTRLLAPLIPRLLNSRGTVQQEERRSYLALDWMIRAYTPAFLDLIPALAEHAAALRGLPAIVNITTAQACNDSVRRAHSAAAAAGAAARAAAGAAAWAAARAAAWDAARGAAWAAARAAAWDAARDAAWDAAWDAAGDAAGAAAGAAAWDAAGDAAGDRLAPLVAILQASALDLIDRMLAVSS